MSKKKIVVMPRTAKYLSQMGEQIHLARLRRKLSSSLVAKRAGISLPTLYAIEKGSPTVAIGNYANVLMALGGMDQDLLNIAKDDIVGRTMVDLEIPIPRRAPKEKKK